MTSEPVKKPSATKSLCLFTNILDVQPKTAKRRFVVAKSRRKSMKVCNSLWTKKSKIKGHSKINYQIKRSLYTWISLTRPLCSSLTDTWSKNLGTSWGSVWSYNTTLRQSLKIGDWTTWGWCVIHVYRLRLICSLIFECPFLLVFLSKGYYTLSWICVSILQPQIDVWLF